MNSTKCNAILFRMFFVEKLYGKCSPYTTKYLTRATIAMLWHQIMPFISIERVRMNEE